MEKLIYICDEDRHLICIPYSVENLHRMAVELNIGKHFYHISKKRRLRHYDIPARRIDEIMAKCILIPWRDIVKIIRTVYP